MTGHCSGHTPDVVSTCAQEVVPQPHWRGQLGVIPGKTAYIVTPFLALIIVGVHDIAVVPESIPFVALNVSLISLDVTLESLLNLICGIFG